MKKLISILLCIALALGSVTFAAAEEAGTVDTTFDMSDEQQKIAELGIPTVDSVAELKKKADALWKENNYKEAAPAYRVYAKQANWLANILSAGLEPYYSSTSKTKGYYINDTMVKAEEKANSYKAERNRAMLNEGMCYYYLQDYEMALPLLIKALDVIEVDDPNWKTGMETLYAIVGFTN